jgi:hypothetical protein
MAKKTNRRGAEAQSKSKTCHCCDCGYEWQRGTDGSHSCMTKMRDRTLLLAAIACGDARWEPFGGANKRQGEICVNGMRHATHLDFHSCPLLTFHSRLELQRLANVRCLESEGAFT